MSYNVSITLGHEKEFKNQRDIGQGSFTSFRKCDKYTIIVLLFIIS
jgi:hypothetical protein